MQTQTYPLAPARAAMNKYRYSKLTSPTNIRLLRLLPKERDPKNIRCELFEYPLQDLSGPFPLYEAISYVWGSKENLQSIIIDDRSFDITRNLFTALRHVRDDKLPRTVWVDAICINQDDTEKERQIGLMAEIYAKASCVIVWLGDAEDDGDPLEAIRLIGEKSTERSVAELSTAELTQQKIPQLLKRRWFQRIWVLQEVAAARHILIKCGSTEIDGHAFCVGLEVVRKALNYPIIPAAFLIYGAVFRSRQISRNHGRLSLDICSLGELVDMYHTHKAEIRHDKIYALLGMCSDHYRLLSEATLEPDYNLEWKILMQRLIMFFIGSKASVHTWNDKEIAVIKSKGSILGKVLKVGSKGGNSQSIEAVFKDTSPRMGTLRDYPVQSSVRWTLRAPAKSIQPGDLICFLEGASEPTIVRLNKEYFTVIMVKAVFPEREKSGDYTIQRSEILQSATFYRDFLLVWDWENFLEQSQDHSNIWKLTKGLKSGLSKIGFESRLSSAVARWNAMKLEGSGEYGKVEEELHGIVESYMEEEHPRMRSEAAGELLLQMDKAGSDANDQYDQVLHYAVMRGHSSMVMLLLGTGKVEVNLKDMGGRTPLLYAAENGHEAVVKLLLDTSKVEVDLKDVRGRTPLLYAARNGHEAVVKLLLSTGKVEVDLKDSDGHTPLLYAAANGHEAVVKLLLGTGKVEVDLKDSYDRTPLSYAARNGHEAVVKLLQSATKDYFIS